ncbi:MAG: hypothetical protein KJ600_01185 [Nanoarchaeota archaeon]|nr:hypothetical protein [Nanoarchaeota archaeon]MBU1103156.1 hypothetical protein [Nanoarchaeota archaeon]
MPEKNEQHSSLITEANRTILMGRLINLPYGLWGRIAESNSYVTAAIPPFRINVSSRPIIETENRENVYEVSFSHTTAPNEKPERKVFSGEDAQELHSHLVRGDNEKKIPVYKTLQELVDETL